MNSEQWIHFHKIILSRLDQLRWYRKSYFGWLKKNSLAADKLSAYKLTERECRRPLFILTTRGLGTVTSSVWLCLLVTGRPELLRCQHLLWKSSSWLNTFMRCLITRYRHKTTSNGCCFYFFWMHTDHIWFFSIESRNWAQASFHK